MSRGAPNWLLRLSTWGLVGLGVSVSMGAALISLFKLWVLLSALGFIVVQWRGAEPPQDFSWPSSMKWLLALWAWMVVSGLWSPAETREQWLAFDRYSRLLVLPVAWYVLRWTQAHEVALKGFVVGQLVVVVSSYLMVLGVPVPWATDRFPSELGVVFTSVLEQPIMMGLLAWVLFQQRKSFGPIATKLAWLMIILALFNALVLGSGRSGYVAGAIVLMLMGWDLLPKRLKAFAVLLPIMALSVSFGVSQRVQDRMTQAFADVHRYQQSETLKAESLGSQGERLNYWVRSLDMVRDHPVLGVGLGAWRMHYHQYGGLQQQAPSNPHHQYLLIAAEGGLVGLALLLAWLVGVWRDARWVLAPAALRGVVLIAAVMGLFNCPFYGVGMGEMLLLLFALLLKPPANQA